MLVTGPNGSESSCLVVMERRQPTAYFPLSLSVLIALTFSVPLAFSLFALFFLALAEINRRYLTLMWEHNVCCSVKTTFVSATVLFARGNCAALSCEAAWRYSCHRKRERGRWERGILCYVEMKRMCCSSMWHMRRPVWLIVPLADASASTPFWSATSLTS